MVNLIIHTDVGGATTSIFSLILEHLLQVESSSISNVYISKGATEYNSTLNHASSPEVRNKILSHNQWDLVLDQNANLEYDKELHITDGTNQYVDCIHSYDLCKRYNRALNQNLSFHPTLLNRVNTLYKDLNINENTLGVHLRLTDMNQIHSNEYEDVNFDTYVNSINETLITNPNIDKVFIASESHKLISQLNDILDIPVISCPNIKRINTDLGKIKCHTETVDLWAYENYFQDVFIDIFLLSKCPRLIGRISGISLTALVLNPELHNNFKLINKINKK